ncbi:MAG: RNA-protein complex protein Nop10 [archaeon]|nr:RNA-protein complex protein Nop10 [archaeon]
MKSKIRKCEACGEYTLKEVCEKCGRVTKNPLPPRFSPKDPYGKYRRMMKYARDRNTRAKKGEIEEARDDRGASRSGKRRKVGS